MVKRIREKLMRADENSRAVIFNICGAFAVKGGALVVTLLATPAYIGYFNDNSALGLWYTLLSVITWVLNFDLGIGNGLRNKLAKSLAEKDYERSRRYISSGYIAVGAVVVLVLAAAALGFGYVNWGKVFNISGDVVSPRALELSVKIVFFGIVIQFFLRLISSILYALQLSSVNNALSLVTSVLTLIYVLTAAPGTNDENLISMAIVHIFAANVPLLAVTIIVFATKLKHVRPSVKYFGMGYAKEILGLGGAFFLVQVAYMILINTNEYLISFFSDSAYVVDYQIYYKLFTLIGTVATISLTPIWSAVTKAFSEKKYTWVFGLYRKLVLFGGLTCVIEFLFLFFIQFCVNIWLGEKAIQIDYGYALIFAFLGSLMVLNGVVSSFANGVGRLKPQLLCFGIGAILKTPASYFLIRLTDSWIGIIISVDIVLLIYVVVQMIDLNKFLRMERT